MSTQTGQQATKTRLVRAISSGQLICETIVSSYVLYTQYVHYVVYNCISHFCIIYFLHMQHERVRDLLYSKVDGQVEQT